MENFHVTGVESLMPVVMWMVFMAQTRDCSWTLGHFFVCLVTKRSRKVTILEAFIFFHYWCLRQIGDAASSSSCVLQNHSCRIYNFKVLEILLKSVRLIFWSLQFVLYLVCEFLHSVDAVTQSLLHLSH